MGFLDPDRQVLANQQDIVVVDKNQKIAVVIGVECQVAPTLGKKSRKNQDL